VPFVLMDSRLEDLMLPIIKPLLPENTPNVATIPRLVTTLLEPFFEWKAIIEVVKAGECAWFLALLPSNLAQRKISPLPKSMD
jgi:hypothetical protein